MPHRAPLLACVALAGCAHAGMSESVRADITARMESARPALTDCYARELKLDRKLRGLIVLTFVAAPGTGAFVDLAIARDDMNDPALETCVTAAVAALRLATPQRTRQAVTYPLDFAPSK